MRVEAWVTLRNWWNLVEVFIVKGQQIEIVLLPQGIKEQIVDETGGMPGLLSLK